MSNTESEEEQIKKALCFFLTPEDQIDHVL